ncbi:MAG: hypothetical protein R3B45_16870 [Bdellovibrionota bacterium]
MFYFVSEFGTLLLCGLDSIETSHSLAISLFFWGLGGFVGSSFVGFWIDFTKKPQAVMAFILVGLMLAIITIPITKDLPYFGLLSYFMWGVFGWAMPTPQQHILFQICESQKAILSALNSSAIGLGSSIGTAIGGAIIARGFNVADLPYLSAFLLIFVFFCQLMLINRSKLRSLLV